MHAMAETLTHLLVWLSNETLAAGLLIGVIWLLLVAVGRHMTPGWRCALWLVLIVRLLCPWLPSSRFSLYQILPRIDRNVLEAVFSHRTLWLWMGVWLTGGVGMSIYILAYHWRLRRRVAREHRIRSQLANDILEACCDQLDVSNTLRLKLTQHVQVPTLLGCFRPSLLIPRSMASLFSRRRLQHVFLHELAHHKRCDLWVRWLATLCQVIHWFNPLVWLAFYAMRNDCELACDRLALSRLDATQPRQYGQTLIRLIEHVSYRHQLAALAAGLAQDRFQLKKRLLTISRFQPFNGLSGNWPVLLLVVLILTGLTDAQRQTGTAEVTQSNPAIVTYYSPLREHPGNRFLFDKFYETWLDSESPESLESFLEAALARTQDFADRLLLAFAYERLGRKAEALDLYRQGAALEGVGAEFLFYKAQAEARQLEFKMAIADLLRLKALSHSEELAEKAGKLLGELYIRTHQRDKATALWQELLAQGTDNESLYEDLIELQIKEGLFDEALKTSQALIAKTQDPYLAVTRRLRQGDIYQYKADRSQALAVYAQALEDVGQGSWLENQICAQIEQVFEREGDLEGLRDFLTTLVAKHAQRLGLKKRLAQLLVQLGQSDRAVVLFQEILKAEPGDKAHQKDYVGILTQAGQRDKAIPLLESLCAQHSEDTELLLMLADLYHQEKQNDQVVSVLQRFLENSDETEYTYLRAAGLFESYGLIDQANDTYKRMCAALPKNLSARLAYAEFLYKQDQIEAALALFQRVAEQGDLQMMIRACNAAGTRGHYDRSLVWAEARYPEFSTQGTYLNHLCKLAIRLEQFGKAGVWARAQLQLAETYPTIRVALAQVLAALGSGETVPSLIQELESKTAPSIQEICLLSELYEMENRLYEADALLAQAAKQHPEFALHQQIHLQRSRGDWARAAASLETLLEKTDRRQISLIRELVELYEKSNQVEAALKWVTLWQEIAPTSAAPRLRHAQLLRSQGLPDQALQLLGGAQREFEDNPEVLSQLADLYTTTGKHEEAQRVYWRVLQVAQNTADKLRAIAHLTEVAGKLGQYQGLIDKLKHAQQKDPLSAIPLLGLAEVYKQMGSYEERRQALLAASRIQTDDVQLLFELARLEEAHGDWEKAIETLQRAMVLDKASEARLKLARLCIQHGDQEDGLRILSELAGGENIDPRDVESIAATILSMGRWELAARFLQGLLSLHPKDYKLHYQYAIALEEAGRIEEAREAFVDLLGFIEEIDGTITNPPPFVWKRQGVDTRLQQILPPAAIDLLRIRQAHDKATRYKHDRQRAQRRSSAPVVTHVTQPATIHELELFALSHLLTLAADMDDRQREQLRYDLHRHGNPHAGLLLTVSEQAGGWSRFQQAIDQLAERYPDHRVIQAIWILDRIEGRGCNLSEAEHIFKLFETSNPRLAITVGLRCYGKDTVASRLFSQSLRMLRQVKDPGYYEAMAIAVTLQQTNSPVTLTKEQRSLLNDYLLDWYSRLNISGPNRDYIFDYVASLLRQRDNLGAYIKLLDDEIKRYTAPATSVAARPSSQPLITELPFPPDTLPDFPDHVLQSVLHGSRYPMWPPQRPTGVRPSQLGPYVDKAWNPVLQVILAMVANRLQEAEVLIQTMLKDRPTALTPYLLGASLAAKQNRIEEAMALLDKARSLPMSTRYQALIDGALVASAQKFDPQQHPHEWALGQQAAIRLMSHQLDPWQREELIVAANMLDLTTQAQNLRNQIPASAATSASSAGRQLPSYVRGQGTEIIKEYFAKGQVDSALRLCISSLRSDVQQSLQPDFYRTLSSSTQSLLEFIKTHRLSAKLLKQADPGDKSTAQRLTEFGRVCELLGQDEQALAAYKKAIALNPQASAGHVHSILLLAVTAPDQCSDALAAVDRGCLPQVGSGLERNIRYLLHHSEFEAGLALVDEITDALCQIPNPGKLDLAWVDRIAEATAEAYYSKRQPLVSLYLPQQTMNMFSTAGKGGSFSFKTTWSQNVGQSQPTVRSYRSPGLEPVRTNTPLDKKRRAVHNRLCRAMLDIPQLAEEGFSRLAAEARAREALTEEFTTMARHALLTSQSPNTSSTSAAPVHRAGFHNPVGPAEFLVQQAQQTDSLDKLIAEFKPQLEQQGQNEQAQRLQHFADLYRVMPEYSKPSRAQLPMNAMSTPTFTFGQPAIRTQRDPNRIQLRQDLSRVRRNQRLRDRRRTNP